MSGSAITAGIKRVGPVRRWLLGIAAAGLCCAVLVPDSAQAGLFDGFFRGPRRNVAPPPRAWDLPQRERRPSASKPRKKAPASAEAKRAAPKKAAAKTRKRKGKAASEVASSGAIQAPQYYVYKAEKMAPVDFAPLRTLSQTASGDR